MPSKWTSPRCLCITIGSFSGCTIIAAVAAIFILNPPSKAEEGIRSSQLASGIHTIDSLTLYSQITGSTESGIPVYLTPFSNILLLLGLAIYQHFIINSNKMQNVIRNDNDVV